MLASHRLRTMTPIWIGRIAIPFLALTAACGAAFVSGFPRERQLPVEASAATSAATVARPAGAVEMNEPAPLRWRPPHLPFRPVRQAAVMRSCLSSTSHSLGEGVMRLSLGTAAPGATVELLRNGEPVD